MRKVCGLLPLALIVASAQTDEVQKLREQIAAQQKQLDGLRAALDSAQSAIDTQKKELDRLIAVKAGPAPAGTQTAFVNPPAKPPAGPETGEKPQAPAPLSFRIGSAEFTPGGFMDFSNAWRSTNIGSGVATSFSGIPLSNTAAGRTQEFRSSAMNSRITLTIAEKATPNTLVTGYLEGDFYGNNAGNVYVVSNSSTFRMRHFWANVEHGKWEVLGGQTWTLLTPNRAGTSQVSSNVFVGLGEDSNYMVGLVWGRPGQLRVTYHPNKHWSIATAIENSQQYVTPATMLPAWAATQVDNGSVPTAPNVRPDIVAKVAYDTQVSGRAVHFELAGFSRQFRVSPALDTYSNAQGLGGSVGANVEIWKNFRLMTTGFYSSGGGREIAGLGPDLVIGPNGAISPVHSMAGIAGFEYAPNPAMTFFGYYSGSYFNRNYMLVSPGNYLGYGYPGSSSSANRDFQEPMFGYYYTFWKNPRIGALQFIGQYSYVMRSPWWVAPGTAWDAHAHMAFGSLRFTLP